jgi:hypothetical protein
MYHISNHSIHTVFRLFFTLIGPIMLFSYPLDLLAGDYMDSAHGNKDIGVYRADIGDAPPQGFGYSRGNCAHCHEQHASIGGSEPDPVTGNPSSFSLFANNFSGVSSGGYTETDNFCFYCHNNTASAQVVLNNDYSQTFGCAGQGKTSLLETMNQLSAHNLYDIIDNFADGTYSWFTNESNPCNACHNPHLAKQNKSDATDPTLSAISLLSNHFTLWGTTETMESSYNTRYEPPICTTNREPAGSADANTGRANTPDYVAFCTDCHDDTNLISSTPLGVNLTTIDWETGDKHGRIAARADVTLREPYVSAGTGNFVLSCLDCHEPHGAPNIMLIRRRVNGSDLIGGTITTPITDLNSNQWGYLCRKCHPDDDEANAGTRDVNKWQYVHHKAPGSPFPIPPGRPCGACHASFGGGSASPISCGTTSLTSQCHGHGKSF